VGCWRREANTCFLSTCTRNGIWCPHGDSTCRIMCSPSRCYFGELNWNDTAWCCGSKIIFKQISISYLCIIPVFSLLSTFCEIRLGFDFQSGTVLHNWHQIPIPLRKTSLRDIIVAINWSAFLILWKRTIQAQVKAATICFITFEEGTDLGMGNSGITQSLLWAIFNPF
jgi:hypothetical protein